MTGAGGRTLRESVWQPVVVGAVLVATGVAVELTGRWLGFAAMAAAAIMSIVRLAGPEHARDTAHRCLALVAPPALAMAGALVIIDIPILDVFLGVLAATYVGAFCFVDVGVIVRVRKPSMMRFAVPLLLGLAVVCGGVTLTTHDGNWPTTLMGHAWKIVKGGATQDVTRSDATPSKCDTVDDVRTWLDDQFEDDPGASTAFYDAWEHVGRPLIGCPADKPLRIGTMWSIPLRGGQERAVLVGDSRAAAVIYASDFAETVTARLSEFTSIDARHRWGLGTMQVVYFRDGACSLLQRYESLTDLTYAVPPAVTHLIGDLAQRDRAYPRVVDVTGVGIHRYDVALLAPSTTGNGTKVVRRVAITYSQQDGVAIAGPRTARDTDRCPGSVVSLATYAAGLEEAVQDIRRAEP